MVWRGGWLGVDLWSPHRGGKNKEQQKNGKGKARKCIPTYIGEKSYPAGRPHARVVVVDVDVHIFNIKNRVERGVELKFSPVGC